MKQPLTGRQSEILLFIADYLQQQNRPPTLREIAKRFGFRSTTGVRDHLDALIRKGYLTREPGTARGISLAEGYNPHSPRIPLVGRVAAGEPTWTLEEVEEDVLVDRRLLGLSESEEAFALRVQGTSMIDAGIAPGDLAIIKRTQEAHRGDIVVALVGDEATIKRYIPENNRVILMPENNAYDPVIIEYESDELTIVGRLVGLLKAF